MHGIIKSTLPAVIAIALSTVSAAGFAAESGKEKQQSKGWPSFKQADADNNGAISQDEAKTVSGLQTNFSQYDKNNDGQLSRSEYESAKKAKSGSASKSGDASSGASGSSGSGASGSSKPGASGGSGGSSSK